MTKLKTLYDYIEKRKFSLSITELESPSIVNDYEDEDKIKRKMKIWQAMAKSK